METSKISPLREQNELKMKRNDREAFLVDSNTVHVQDRVPKFDPTQQKHARANSKLRQPKNRKSEGLLSKRVSLYKRTHVSFLCTHTHSVVVSRCKCMHLLADSVDELFGHLTPQLRRPALQMENTKTISTLFTGG